MKVYEAQVEMLTRQLADMQGRLDTFEQGNSLRLSEETSSITDDFRKTREENDQLRLQISVSSFFPILFHEICARLYVHVCIV
jgi:hypothetical protein